MIYHKINYLCNYKIMIDMKLLVKELCKKHGLTLSQLADKMGVSLSNLSASISGNPSLKRLEDIAKNLGVDIYDLFEKPEDASGIVGLVDIQGESYKIFSAKDWMKVCGKVPGFIDFFVYDKDSDLLNDIKKFIHEGIEKKNCASMSGRFGIFEAFVLSRISQEVYDNISNEYFYDMVYTLTLVAQKRTQTFSLLEYIDGESYDIDSDGGMAMAIRNEIEAPLSSSESTFEDYDD